MSKSIKLSIIVISYNNGLYIKDCLESIERQGISDYEVLIVDDCSTDDTESVVDSFISDKPQFKLIKKDSNSGGAISSQIGLAMSRGEYCAIIDSDDVLAEGAYRTLIGRIEEDNSDFAIGFPQRLMGGTSLQLLDIISEHTMFSTKRVLESKEDFEKCVLTAPFYWNAVFKSKFIKDNNIVMPSSLLIADRIFMYKAYLTANRVSIDPSVVYYWRRKKNPDNLSIVDRQCEFKVIADRCDSFAAQIRLSLECDADNSELSRAIWESSFKRLYYPLNEFSKSEFIERESFFNICNRYRLLLLEYYAFFKHLIYTCDLPTNTVFLTDALIRGKFEDVLRYVSGEKDLENFSRQIPNVINDVVSRNSGLVTLSGITNADDAVFLTFRYKNDVRSYEMPVIHRALFYSCHYRCKQYELPFDNQYLRVDISKLPCATYNVALEASSDGVPYFLSIGARAKTSRQIYYDDRKRVYRIKTKGNPIIIYSKNEYTILKSRRGYYIWVHHFDEMERLFFYNENNNEEQDLQYENGGLYKLDTEALHQGRNLLLIQWKSRIYSTVSKEELTNHKLEMNEFDFLFRNGRVEVCVN